MKDKIKDPHLSHSAAEDKLLTEVELELMTILWSLGEGSVGDVQKHLEKNRNLAYTSISTILRILEQKKILTTRKEGRGHIYIPLLLKEQYESKSVKHLVNKVFNGAPLALIKQLFNSVDVDQNEIEEIRKMLSEKGHP